MIYLASPYSHPESSVRLMRYDHVCKAAAVCAKNGAKVISPIAHWHPIALQYDLPKDANYWADINDELVDMASELWVLMLDGWQESAGVQSEIKRAKALHIPVSYLSWPSLELDIDPTLRAV